LNENVRIMADYRKSIDVKQREGLADSNLEDVDTFTLRGQWAF